MIDVEENPSHHVPLFICLRGLPIRVDVIVDVESIFDARDTGLNETIAT